MAEGKKSFILYCDQKGLWNKLSNEQAGVLIKHIIAYVNDENPVAPDFVTEIAFEPIKALLKRDLKKWETQQEQRREAGRRSAEVRKANSTSVDDRSISSTVNGSVSDSVSDNVSDVSKETMGAFFQNEELNFVFSKWLKMCKEKRKEYPSGSIEAIQMKLTSDGDKVAIRKVSQSLENGWVTLQPLDEKKPNPKKVSIEELTDDDYLQ